MESSHGPGGLVPVVLDDELQRPPVHAASAIDVLEVELRTGTDLLTQEGQGPREIHDHAYPDYVVRNAFGSFGLLVGGAGQEDGCTEDHHSESRSPRHLVLHGSLPF